MHWVAMGPRNSPGLLFDCLRYFSTSHQVLLRKLGSNNIDISVRSIPLSQQLRNQMFKVLDGVSEAWCLKVTFPNRQRPWRRPMRIAVLWPMPTSQVSWPFPRQGIQKKLGFQLAWNQQRPEVAEDSPDMASGSSEVQQRSGF